MRILFVIAACAAAVGPAVARPLDAGQWAVGGYIGTEFVVDGDLHGGATAAVPDLGPLNPALAGVNAELRIGARSFEDIYGEGFGYGVTVERGIGADREIFASLNRLETDEGATQVGGAFVPALNAELPVFGRFGAYESTSIEAGVRQYFGAAALRPFIGGRLGAAQVSDINATFTIPDGGITIANAPFYGETTTFTAGVDAGVTLAVGERVDVTAETGLRFQSGLDGDDAAIGGFGLAAINEEGERITVPLSLRGRVRF